MKFLYFLAFVYITFVPFFILHKLMFLFKIVRDCSVLILYSFLFQRSVEVNATKKQDLRSFKLILEYIKALPVGAFMQFSLIVALI